MGKIVKNLSQIKVNKSGDEWELNLPTVDDTGRLVDVAYTDIINSFTESQTLVLKPVNTIESSELVGKSLKYDRATGIHDSGTSSSKLTIDLKDKSNNSIASSILEASSGTTSAYLSVPNKDGTTVATLGINFNPTTNKFDSFAPNTSENSADNAIVTKKYLEEQLEGYVSSGEAVNVETATNDTYGIVLLSDTSGTADSINGGTAVTPKALQTVKAALEKADEDIITAYKQADAALRNDLEQQIAQGGGGGNFGYIVTPTLTNPTHDSTDQSTLINIIGTAFKSVFEDDAREVRHFQVASDEEFLTIVKEKEINADSWLIDPPQLSDNTKYYVRIRDKATSGFYSSWSTIRAFTTGEGLRPANPVVTLKGYNNSPTDIGSGLTIETAPFSIDGGEDTHKATSWSIATKGRANVWESLNDTVNKTSITVPVGTLQKATEYVLTVVFHGTNYGDSNPVTVDFTTSSDFGTVNTPTLTVEGAPNAVYETPTLTGGAFSNTREPDTHEATDWEIVPSSGGEAVWQSLSNTSNKTSIDVPEDILQVSIAYTARVRYKGTNFGWSSWTEKQFTTANVFALVGTPVISGATSEVKDSQQFTASAFSMTVGSGEHDKSDWILVKANAASVEVWSSKNDTVNKTVCPSLAEVLEVSTSYILKVRYHDSINDIWSEYGQLAFTTADRFPQPADPNISNRVIYRHESNQGSVVVFDMFSKSVELFVPDAKYREVKVWGTKGIDIPNLSNFNSADKYINPNNTADSKISTLSYTMTDKQLQARFPSFSADKTAKENTDILMGYSDTDAAHWCRSQNIAGVGKMDLPNAYELMVLYLEADRIDALDPTVNSYQSYALGKLNIHGRFDFAATTRVWSSTESSFIHTRYITTEGKMGNDIKWDGSGIIPVLELSVEDNPLYVDPENTNKIGVAGTANFGVGIAKVSDATSLGLSQCENCCTPNHFEYGLYTKTIPVKTAAGKTLSVPCYFKYIPKFYIKYLQKDDVGTNLTDEELDLILPYVDVTKEQMKEAQRRSPFNAMVVASADKFANKDEAQTQGFILPRGFIDGDVEKNGVFILNSLVSGTGNTKKLTSLAFGVPSTSVASNLIPLSLHLNTFVDSTLIANMDRYSLDAINISKLVGEEFNCCSAFVWAIISLLSLIQGQYATSNSECAWYDRELTTNFPKGINNNGQDFNDSSVIAFLGADPNVPDKPNTIVNSGYEKTTHNGSITGITNVNGWMFQWCTGYTYTSGDYKYLGTSHKISEITEENVRSICDVSLGNSLDAIGVVPISNWGSSSKSSFSRDFSGDKWAMNGIFSYANDSSGTNEFGVDQHDFRSFDGLTVGGHWKNSSVAGVFFRCGTVNWAQSGVRNGFRTIAYPV